VHTDLSLLANATAPFVLAVNSPTSCLRPDNVFSVVYTGKDKHIHALQVIEGAVSHVDLTALAAGAPRSNGVGTLTHFVRGDGVPVVVYVGLTGTGSDDPVRTHVDELAFIAGDWAHSDLSAATQSSDSASFFSTPRGT
jgi:hypothetical protein